jgi:hypothetical protein
MKEQFDKELRDHIKDTFDVYNDLMEDDGWLKYTQKVKRKKYRAILIWSLPGGIAAALALVWLLNIGTQTDLEDKTQVVALKPVPEFEGKNALPSKIEKLSQEENKSSNKPSLKEEAIFSANDEATKNAHPSSAIEVVNVGFVDTTAVPTYTTSSPALIAESNSAVPKVNEEKPAIQEVMPAPAEQEFIASTPKDIKNSFSQPQTGFNNTFSDLAANVNADKRDENPVKKYTSNKFKIGLDASTFMNFTKEGVGQDMNLGVGLVSEYKISKNISINSGININKQSASYTANSGDIRESAKNASFADALAPMATPVINQHSSNAKLVGFDIPFAIKYSSNNKNLNWFLSTGFSSYTLLTETYLDNISIVNYGFNGIQTTNEVITQEHKDGLFSNLQLARTLNFSVGIQFPIKNVTSLSVEPFIKYPLRSFGREDLTIGSSGVSLKMNLDKRLFK